MTRPLSAWLLLPLTLACAPTTTPTPDAGPAPEPDAGPEPEVVYRAAEFLQWCTFTTDDRDDGVIDREVVRTFDDNDRLVREETDEGDDGVIDQVDDFTLNEAGQVIERRVAQDPDGANHVFYFRFLYEDDLMRQIISEFSEERLQYERSDHEFDEFGRITEHVLTRQQVGIPSIDQNGSAPQTTTWTYHGDTERYAREETDAFNDGSPDRIIETVLLDGPLFYEERWDENADGVVDFTITAELVASEFPRLIEFDDDLDGVVDRAQRFDYDEDGRVVSTKFDFDGDESFDAELRYEWNADDDVIIRRDINLVTGLVTSLIRFDFSCRDEPLL